MIRITRTQEKDGFVWYEAEDGRGNSLLHYSIDGLLRSMVMTWSVSPFFPNFNLN